MTDWANVKGELNELKSKLIHIHSNLPYQYSPNSPEGWDLAEAWAACGHLRSAIEALEPLTKKTNP
jgi:hypothetical protein